MIEEGTTFMIENADMVWPNFSGEEKRFNKAGDRNFCVFLEPDFADALAADGWNIKVWNGKEEGDEDRPYIQVALKYKFKPPRVVMLTSVSRTNLTEDTVGILDWANIQTVDFIARAHIWDVNGKTGVKAYLQSMFITIEEDELERKYALVNPEE